MPRTTSRRLRGPAARLAGSRQRRTFEFQLTTPAFLVVLAWVSLMGTYGVARTDAAQLWELVPAGAFVRAHMSNFALSSILLLVAGGRVLLEDLPRWRMWAWAGALALVNVLVESVVTVLNTPDPVDAAAGLLGLAITMLGLVVIGRVGLRRPAVPGSGLAARSSGAGAAPLDEAARTECSR
ncbi:hypothetical protein JOD57_003161 [Geodermatophilus bullaregiensis]|uniref:hypothetical protein n=1 Tax=Geodermatophilus bullaregiensis TaxID=1564160 RepID=UPI00195E24C5|nr:hypothetical protein [Geodermatophilus bullaregiensis]MBM7807324.1 hypothetical protein [Geodermatophilus bullaregiensis]